MKKLLMVLLMVMACIGSASAFIDKYTLNREDLPEEARSFLNEHFPWAKVSMIKVDRHLLKKTDYNVKLVNGTKIEFNPKGKWTSIDCKKRSVPEALVTKPIRKYLDKNYAGNKVVNFDKKISGYEVGLCDGQELKFSLIGSFTGKKTQAEIEADNQDDNDEEEENS